MNRLTSFIVVCVIYSCAKQAPPVSEAYHIQALKESQQPVRPGEPGARAFWNTRALKFIYPPAFDFKPVDGATNYSFTATSVVNGSDYVFTAPQPWAALTPIWNKLPVGYVLLKVEALAQQGRVLGIAGAREFYKDAAFHGPYQPAAVDYRESSRRGLAYLFQQKYVQYWAKAGVPDPTYPLYCYPSKVIGAVISSMARYACLAPVDSLRAITIAKNAANYLIRISEPAGGPLAFFPPTYSGDTLSAKSYPGQNMIPCPAEAGMYYLDLFDVSQDTVYMQAAVRIADTYLKLQLSSGTWHLKVFVDTGLPVQQNLSIPTVIIEFFERLRSQYHQVQYQAACRRAFDWMMANPATTFNWEGQFEDVEPSLPFQNLTEHQACSLAMYLLDHLQDHSSYDRLIADLLHFSEDLFVIWQSPFSTALALNKVPADDWLTPCVLEQYRCYLPVDASSSKMIETFAKYYEKTGNELYLAKAVALANNMTQVQQRYGGRYITWWQKNDRGWQEDWINCANYDATVMLKISAMIEHMDKAQPDIRKKPLALLLAKPADIVITHELVRRYQQSIDPSLRIELLTAITLQSALVAQPLLIEASQVADANLQAAAVSLLGRFNTPETNNIIVNRIAQDSAETHPLALHACLQIADQLAESNKTEAEKYYRLVLSHNAAPSDTRKALLAMEANQKDSLIISKLNEIKIKHQKMAKKLGFITNWRLAGPFPIAENDFEAIFFPENGLNFSQTQLFGKKSIGWTSISTDNIYGILNFSDWYGPIPGVMYGYAELHLPQEQPAQLKIGSNDGVSLWLNGKKIHHNPAGRILTLDEDILNVVFAKGKNKFLLRVFNMGGPWQACLRVGNEKGLPVDISNW